MKIGNLSRKSKLRRGGNKLRREGISKREVGNKILDLDRGLMTMSRRKGKRGTWNRRRDGGEEKEGRDCEEEE